MSDSLIEEVMRWILPGYAKAQEAARQQAEDALQQAAAELSGKQQEMGMPVTVRVDQFPFDASRLPLGSGIRRANTGDLEE